MGRVVATPFHASLKPVISDIRGPVVSHLPISGVQARLGCLAMDKEPSNTSCLIVLAVDGDAVAVR